MIPSTPILTNAIEEINHPNRTYRAVVDENLITDSNVYKNRINGYVDNLPSVEQSVYLILGTERYKYPIYSWDYGIELIDLFGKPIPYIIAVLPRRIKEALMVDNRISDVVDFNFDKKGSKLAVSFTVITNQGSFSTDLEVNV